jgi:hypothetical protein
MTTTLESAHLCKMSIIKWSIPDHLAGSSATSCEAVAEAALSTPLSQLQMSTATSMRYWQIGACRMIIVLVQITT